LSEGRARYQKRGAPSIGGCPDVLGCRQKRLFREKASGSNMGNAEGRLNDGAHAVAWQAFLRDIGVLCDLPTAEGGDERLPDACLANQRGEVGLQFEALQHTFALCGCDAHAELMHLQRDPDLTPHAVFQRAVAEVSARGDLRRCVERCRGRYCVVALWWQWDPPIGADEQNEHLTLLTMDVTDRVQWFFDPNAFAYRELACSDWMRGTALVDGFEPRVIWYMRNGWSLQNYLEPLGDDDAEGHLGGACTPLGLLLVVAAWRFGVPPPDALIQIVADWLEASFDDKAQHREVKRRLVRWQHAVLRSHHDGDRVALLQLFGCSSPVADVTGRRCAVFEGADVCSAPTVAFRLEDRSRVQLTLCRRHASLLLSPEILPLPDDAPERKRRRDA